MTPGQKKSYFKELHSQKRTDKRRLMPFHGRLHKDTRELEWRAVPAALAEESGWTQVGGLRGAVGAAGARLCPGSRGGRPGLSVQP